VTQSCDFVPITQRRRGRRRTRTWRERERERERDSQSERASSLGTRFHTGVKNKADAILSDTGP